MRTKILCVGFFATLLLLASSTFAGETGFTRTKDLSSVPESARQDPKVFTVIDVDKYVVCDPYYYLVERDKVGFFDVVLAESLRDYEIHFVEFKENPRLAGYIDERKWTILSDNRRREGDFEPYEKVRFLVAVRHKETGKVVVSEDPIIVNE